MPLLLLLTASLVMAGCGITGANANQDLTPVISVSIKQGPPQSMLVGATAIVSATVSNDVAYAGVQWTAVCASAPNCGSFARVISPGVNPTTFTAIFTAPLSVPTNGIIAITALSATDHSKSDAANVTIISTITGITITQPPPASAPGGATIQLAALVAGDLSNAGVDWKATLQFVRVFDRLHARGKASFRSLQEAHSNFWFLRRCNFQLSSAQ